MKTPFIKLYRGIIHLNNQQDSGIRCYSKNAFSTPVDEIIESIDLSNLAHLSLEYKVFIVADDGFAFHGCVNILYDKQNDTAMVMISDVIESDNNQNIGQYSFDFTASKNVGNNKLEVKLLNGNGYNYKYRIIRQILSL